MKMKAFKHYGTVAALAVIILIFSILRPASFCTVKNFLNISRQAAPLAMVALGATFVMTINEFDLSIGNIVSLGGVIAALLSIKQVPVALCFLIAALICLLVGCVNGIVVARFQILSFITTLGMGTVLDGVIYGLTGGTTVFNGIPKAFTIPGILKIAGIPFITLVAVVLYLAFYVFMGHTAPGRKLYAIGGSKEAAEVAGIPIFSTGYWHFPYVARLQVSQVLWWLPESVLPTLLQDKAIFSSLMQPYLSAALYLKAVFPVSWER